MMYIITAILRVLQMTNMRNSMTTKMTMMMRMRPTTQQRITGTITIETLWRKEWEAQGRITKNMNSYDFLA